MCSIKTEMCEYCVFRSQPNLAGNQARNLPVLGEERSSHQRTIDDAAVVVDDSSNALSSLPS